MDKIEDVTDPVVGKRYLVRCAIATRDIVGYKKGEWVPIMGDVHSDAEFGIPDLHLHYDWRFEPGSDLPFSFPVLAIRDRMTGESIIPVDLETAQYRSRKLRRLEVLSHPSAQATKKLDSVGRSLPPCTHLCPHRGFPLNGVPVHDGLKTCPGHQMRFHSDTGLYAPYNDAPA